MRRYRNSTFIAEIRTWYFIYMYICAFMYYRGRLPAIFAKSRICYCPVRITFRFNVTLFCSFFPLVTERLQDYRQNKLLMQCIIREQQEDLKQQEEQSHLNTRRLPL